jgi:hypothetical protein
LRSTSLFLLYLHLFFFWSDGQLKVTIRVRSSLLGMEIIKFSVKVKRLQMLYLNLFRHILGIILFSHYLPVVLSLFVFLHPIDR